MKNKLSETVRAVNAGMKRVGESLFTSPTSRTEYGESQIERGDGPHDDEGNNSQTERRADSEGMREQYLSSEEQVLRHLSEQSDGQAWQATIVKEMAWSASKTSRVLSTMEEHERILRYQIGKQKCVYLPGFEPEIIRESV